MDEPIALEPGGDPVKADRPELSLLETTFDPGSGVDPHFHKGHSDSFYVLEGEVEFHVGDEAFTATPGFVRVPPTSGTPCGTDATFILAAGTSCTLGVQFAPTSSAGGTIDYSAVLRITSDSTAGATMATLTGSSSGFCSDKVDGTGCNDSNACTQSDTCHAGVCSAASHVTCVPLDPCHAPGTCDIGTGVCSNPINAEGTPCNDGDAETCADYCHEGTCVGISATEAAEVDDSLRVAGVGASSTISWTDSPGPFNIYRGTIIPGEPFAYNQGCLNPGAPRAVASFTDELPPPPGTAFFYLVTRTNQCGESIPGRASDSIPIPNNNACPGP